MSAGNTGNRQRCNDEQYIYIGNDDVYWGQKTTDKLLKLRRLTIVSLSDGLRVMPSLSAQWKNSRSVGNNNNNLSGWLAVATRTESTWEANPREARVGEQQSDMQSTVRGQRRRRLRYAAAAGTRTAACGLQCCCWGCIEGLSIAAAPSPRRPPPTFEASKEPTITASRNFLSRLPLHSKLQAYTNSGGGSAISRRRNAASCLQAQWTPLRVLLRPSKHPLWHHHQALTNPPFLRDQYYSEWVPVPSTTTLVALLHWKHQLLSQRAWIRMFHTVKQHCHALPGWRNQQNV